MVTSVLSAWKNQPDAFAAACSFAALVYYIRAQERNAPPVSAAAWYIAACGFKEIAVPLPAVCLALEGVLRLAVDTKMAARRLLRMGGAAAVYLIIRTLAIGGIGYRFGSNAD